MAGITTAADLEKTHSDYDLYLDDWNFYIRSYLGGSHYRRGGYLLQHPFESDKNFIRRKKIAYFYNYCAPVVDILTSYITKQEPIREYGQLSSEAVPPRQPITLFDAFWWDCDLEKSNFNQFMRDAQRYAGIYGRVSIIVDKPNVLATTKLDAITLGARPYLSLVTPENLIDWEFIKLPTGRKVLDTIRIREAKDTYRIWTREMWQLWKVVDGRAQLQSMGYHPLGEIPIVNLYSKKMHTPMIGVSDLEDIADINKNIYSRCSSADEIIDNTAFPMLAMAMDKGAAVTTGEEVEVGPTNILEFDPESVNGKPFWLEAPHSSLVEIREWIQQNANEIARIAKMGGMRNTETSVQPWSMVAIEAVERQLFSTCSEKATNAEQAELDILHLYSKWEGEDFTGDIKYPQEFAIKDLTISLQNAILAGTAKIESLIFEKERQKKVVNAVLPGLEEATREKIYAEIETLTEIIKPTPPPMAPQNTPPSNDPSASGGVQPDGGMGAA